MTSSVGIEATGSTITGFLDLEESGFPFKIKALSTLEGVNDPLMQRRILFFLLFWLLLATVPVQAQGATVELPLFLRTQILQNALAESLTPQADRPTVLFQEGSYNYLHISKPQLSIRDGQPYFSCDAGAGMGFDSLGILPSNVKWSGSILMKLNFHVDSQWQLRYRIIDSAIYDKKGAKPVVSGFAWELSKRFLHPRLEKYAFDLSMPQKDITALLRACASPTNTAPLEEALSTLAVGTLRANDNGLIVPLLLTVSDSQIKAVPPLPKQAPLGFEEIEKLQHVFEPLDAFLVFVIKGLSSDMADKQQQEQLFDLLISSRYQLLAILTGQTPLEDEDPLRLLFIDAWEQLRPIIESSSTKNGLMQKQLLRYMTFINGGDTLLALDKTAPGLGIHITSDGLRRLARMLQPVAGGNGEDPLRFDWQIDPALRDLFQFQPEPEPQFQDFPPDSTGELAPDAADESPADFPPESVPAPMPNSAPQPVPPPPIQEQTIEPTPSPVPAPPLPTPTQTETLESVREQIINPPPEERGPETEPEPAPAPLPDAPLDPAPSATHGLTTGQYIMNFLVGVAYADNLPPLPATKANKRLEHWVPTPEEQDEYEKLITQLLKSFAQAQLKQDSLEPRYAKIYENLVSATAMIESCWQQFERQDDKIVPLRSQAGGIGIMQVNQHVWRGFYNMERLQKDVAYNTQAGNQILMRYFKQYGIQVAKESKNPEIAARAAYAVYNGGPRAARRFMKPDASARQKRVDEHLWELYQKAAKGGRGDLGTCSIL